MYSLSSPFNLREFDAASESDQAFARVLYRSSRGDLLQMQAEPDFIEQLIAMQQRMHDQGYRQSYPQARHLIIERDGAPIGRLIVNPGEQALRVVDITLLPQAQSQGAGSAVLAGLQVLAATQQATVSLGVNHGNLAARRLYARLGFMVEGEDQIQQQLRWSTP
ncbi:GNAT family N-acetyltransferase [Janthinobacterium aquaticum]|uniref:GNAT family N-acetyltransferase n=1 Tax=Janthinobacterium sp. FT58W TaxID=2654254 RepID=UPI0012656496|nr:GNAT family N-acetyltransferase [Janthinobacterium sp. FT58W]KAB8044646.1 GNAT family N-acetyltransferase [Janthinobacterium sp. FT58W]